MSFTVCVKKSGGCGHIGPYITFEGNEGACICPKCGSKEASVRLTFESLAEVTDISNRALAVATLAVEELLATEQGRKELFCVVNCGCVYSAEDGFPCFHDIEHAIQDRVEVYQAS